MALDIEKVAFTVILHAGNAKAEAYRALGEAKQGNFKNIDEYLKNAKNELNEVHSIQTELLTAEASGDNVSIPIILIHAQDHLMTTMSEINLIEELIECTRELRRLSDLISK